MPTLSQTLSQFYLENFGVKPLVDSNESLSAWFTHGFGQNLLAAEKSVMDQLLPEIYGYHLMELSVLKDTLLSEQCPITHHFSISPCHSQNIQAQAVFEQLPIDEESIDAAILHHALEYSTNPHQLLRDTARAIIPNGYIVLIGFNPWGLLQAKKILGRYILRKDHWRYHRLFRNRLLDWLQVLDFDVVFRQNYGFDLPLNCITPKWLDKTLGTCAPFSGNFYVLVARKTKVPMTMIKQPWKKKNRLSQWVKQPVVSRGSIHSSSTKNK